MPLISVTQRWCVGRYNYDNSSIELEVDPKKWARNPTDFLYGKYKADQCLFEYTTGKTYQTHLFYIASFYDTLRTRIYCRGTYKGRIWFGEIIVRTRSRADNDYVIEHITYVYLYESFDGLSDAAKSDETAVDLLQVATQEAYRLLKETSEEYRLTKSYEVLRRRREAEHRYSKYKAELDRVTGAKPKIIRRRSGREEELQSLFGNYHWPPKQDINDYKQIPMVDPEATDPTTPRPTRYKPRMGVAVPNPMAINPDYFLRMIQEYPHQQKIGLRDEQVVEIIDPSGIPRRVRVRQLKQRTVWFSLHGRGPVTLYDVYLLTAWDSFVVASRGIEGAYYFHALITVTSTAPITFEAQIIDFDTDAIKQATARALEWQQARAQARIKEREQRWSEEAARARTRAQKEELAREKAEARARARIEASRSGQL